MTAARSPRIDLAELKARASGQWPNIIAAVCGIDRSILDGNHHPCPKCGGTDRFRMVDEAAGSLFCNQCFSEKNGDGLAAIQWLQGGDFVSALRRVADHLRMSPSAANGKPHAPAAKVYRQFASPKLAVDSLAKLLGGKLAGFWEYRDDFGNLIVIQTRFNRPDGTKEYRPISRNPVGRVSIKAPDGLRPLYRLADIIAASTVYIAEGEKAADAAVSIELIGTTSLNGAKSPQKTNWKPVKGKTVVILPDNDEAGRKYAETVAKFCHESGALSVKIVELPGLPPKGDIVEWIENHGDAAEPNDMRRELEALVDASPIYVQTPTITATSTARILAVGTRVQCGHATTYEPLAEDGASVGDTKIPASEADAMTSAQVMLIETATHREDNEELLKLRYHRGAWWWWQGQRYLQESDSDVEVKIVHQLDKSYAKLTKSVVSNVALCLRAASNIGSHCEMPAWLDDEHPGNWIALNNGVLNLTALLRNDPSPLVKHTPQYFSENVLPYDFDPSAKCPKWTAFLDRNLEGDQERIAIAQQFAGYCLSPSLTFHKFLMNEGEGANGKSVYCAGVTGMLGMANVSSVPLEQFGDQFSMYRTLGKMANVCSEIGDIDRVAEGILKAYTTGDAIQFDRKHRDPITARPTAKLIFASNNRPRFSDKSGGLWRRMILLPWRVTIPEDERVRGMDTPQWWQDQGELPGILLWAIAGLWQLEQQGGFTKSSVCEEALTEYRSESNPARQFLEERFQFNPESWVCCEDVYQPYGQWCKASGFMALSAASLGHEIRRAFPKVKRRRLMAGGERFTAYFGLAKI